MNVDERNHVVAIQSLSNAQIEELLGAIETMRKVIHNQRQMVHGWQLEFVVRRNDPARGDICIIPPSGEKIFSVIGVKRKLGLITAAQEQVTADQALVRLIQPEEESWPSLIASGDDEAKLAEEAERLVGKRGEVFWLEPRGWYEAQVLAWEWSEDELLRRVPVHTVAFEDGQWKLDLMSRNRWRTE